MVSKHTVKAARRWGVFGLLAICIPAWAAPASCERTLRAEVVALEQAMVLNRYGAFNPAMPRSSALRPLSFASSLTCWRSFSEDWLRRAESRFQS